MKAAARGRSASHWVWLGLSLVVWGAAPSAMAVVTELSVDLGPWLRDQSLQPSAIRAVATVSDPAVATWAAGRQGELNFAAVPLERRNGNETSVNGGIKVKYEGLRTEPYSLELCPNGPSQPCSPADVVKSQGSYTAMVEGDTWSFHSYGVPCSKGLTCEGYVPSWAVNQAATNDLAAAEPFPRLALLVDVGSGIAIVNAETQKPWLMLSRDYGSVLQGLGVMREAAFIDQGLLKLTLERGFLFLDFAKDRLVIVDKRGVRQAMGNFALLSDGDFEPVALRPSANGISDLPLIATATLAVWRDGFIVFKLREKPSGEEFHFHEANLVAADETPAGEVVGLAGTSRNKLEKMAYEPTSKRFMAVGSWSTEGMDEDTVDALNFIGGQLFLKTDGGLKLFAGADKDLVNTSLTDVSSGYALYAQDAVVTSQSAPGTCRVEHFLRHETVAEAFKSSTVSVGCGDVVGFSRYQDRVSLSSANGSTVAIAVLSP